MSVEPACVRARMAAEEDAANDDADADADDHGCILPRGAGRTRIPGRRLAVPGEVSGMRLVATL